MSSTQTQDTGLLGARVIRSIRRLIVVAALAVFAYATFMIGSKGSCTPSSTAEDGYRCVILNLRPSGAVYIAVVAIILIALTRVLHRARDESSAVTSIDRAATVIVIVVLASCVISQIWFRLIPLEQWDGTGTLYYPFPFGSVDLTIDRAH